MQWQNFHGFIADKRSLGKDRNSAFVWSLGSWRSWREGKDLSLCLPWGFCGCFEGVGGVGYSSGIDTDALVCPSFKVLFVVFCVSGCDTGNLEGHLRKEFRFFISGRVLP